MKLDNKQMLVCNVYRPPDAKVEWMDEMAVMFEHGVQVGKPVVVIGDLNCDLLHPNLGTCRLGMIRAEYGLTQKVKVPTRVTVNPSTQIDLLFTTHPDELHHVRCDDPGLRDHSLIYGLLKSKVRAKKHTQSGM